MKLTTTTAEIQRIRADLWHRVYETTLRNCGGSYSEIAVKRANAALDRFDLQAPTAPEKE